MPRIVACAVLRDDPPRVFLAEDQDALNWVLALHLIARTPGNELSVDVRAQMREALQEERWRAAVELRRQDRPEVDVYPSFELFTATKLELAALEFAFTPED